MAVLNWGECDLKHATSTDGAPTGEWDELPTPKEDSTQLTTTAGTEKTATEEGGALVDYLPGKNTYQLEWDEFVKKGEEPSFEDNDGVFRLTEPSCVSRTATRPQTDSCATMWLVR